jgi:two-component system NtrC family response regulator
MPLPMQAKLLVALNNQLVQRLGSSRWSRVNMRVIAATNIPMKELVAAGLMRNDFYYRLNVISIQLVPLRQRLQDIPLLVQDFLRHHPISIRKTISSASAAAMDRLMSHNWPGNIRELQNVLEKAIVLSRSRTIEDVEVSDPFADGPETGIEVPREYSLEQWIQAQEKEYLIAKLQTHGGRIDLTARSCGVDVRTLHRKMRMHGLDRKIFHSKEQEVTTE